MNSTKKDFPIYYWLTKFKGKKYNKLIVDSLEASSSIKKIGKKYELIKPEIKVEITEKIVNCILHNQEPNEKLRNLLMLLSLRTVNWEVLPKPIDIKNEKVKFRLTTFQEMNFKDEIGFYLTNLVPKTVYRKTSGARVVRTRTKL